MSDLSRKFRLLPAIGLVALAAGCGGPAVNSLHPSAASAARPLSRSTSNNSTLSIAMTEEPPTLDPQKEGVLYIWQITNNIYDRLMDKTASGKLVPSLASAPPKLVNPTTWQFHLRPAIKFTDGEPLNAAAVVFSVNRILTEKLNGWLPFIPGIKSATAVNNLTVDIHTSGVDPLAPEEMFFINIMPPKATQDTNIGQHPVGSGPYEFVNWAHGSSITLKRNPHYWGPKPSIAKVTFLFSANDAVRVSLLKSGEAQIADGLTVSDAATVPVVASRSGVLVYGMELNMIKGITTSLKVRQALNYAVNTKEIIRSVFKGYAQQNQCQLTIPTTFGYDKQLHAYPYDPAKARQLLTEAGAEGATLQLVSPSGWFAEDEEFSAAVASYWTAVGLNVQITNLNETTDNEVLYPAVKADTPTTGLFDHNNLVGDASLDLSTWYDNGPNGYAPVTVAAEHTLFEESLHTTNQKARLSYIHKALGLGCQDAMFYFGVHPQDIYGVSKTVSFTPRPDGLFYVSDIRFK